MKVVVLGAGVIGVTTAYYLAQAGHDVVVIDRQLEPARETSFANAGEISPGYASPWAAPGIPQKAIRWLFMKHAPLILQPKIDPAMIAWLFALLGNCTAKRYAINKSRMGRLANYSRAKLEQLRNDTGIQYDQRMQGTLQLFRKQSDLDKIGKDVDVLRSEGVAYEVLDQDQCVAAEPGLAFSGEHIAGGLRLPGDETGDCQKFTVALAARAAMLGVTFRFGVKVQGIQRAGDRIVSVLTDSGEFRADEFVVALGSFTPAMVRNLGLHVPVYPVKGYSITAPIINEMRAPVSTLMDESYKIAITRLGDRIRVGGMAEVSGFGNNLPPRRRATLVHSLESLFPSAGDTKAASYWSGLRPMTPDGTPVVGRTRYANLTLNTGHGTLGWTMACGSGQVVSDIISNRQPEIDVGDLALSRYTRAPRTVSTVGAQLPGSVATAS